MKINWHVLKIAKAHFKYTIWFMISEKNCCELPIRFFTVVVHACTKCLSKQGLHEKCPNTELFLVRIFLYLD